MTVQTKAVLKTYFQTGNRPSQSQYGDLIDSFQEILSPTNLATPANGGTGVSNNNLSTIAINGAFGLTLALSATTSLTLPTSGTVATRAGAETLTNKTLTAPIISTISNTGTLTLPTSTDTLVGRATTDTLTNKTLTSPAINTPVITDGTYNRLTPWVAYTPTTISGLGTITNGYFRSRRNGGNLEVYGSGTTGTVDGNQMQISIGFNGTSGNVASDNSGLIPTLAVVGVFTRASSFAGSLYVLIDANSSLLYFGAQAAGTSGLAKAAGNGIIGNTTLFSYYASIPISNWS